MKKGALNEGGSSNEGGVAAWWWPQASSGPLANLTGLSTSQGAVPIRAPRLKSTGRSQFEEPVPS